MNDDTEGLLVAHVCLLQALIHSLAARGDLSPAEVLSIASEAEAYLAGLLPDLMTPGARDYARRILQQIGKISPSC